MTENTAPRRAHLIAGGFPPGAPAGHDHDYARLRLLGLLADQAGASFRRQRLFRPGKMAAAQPAADHLRCRPVSGRDAMRCAAAWLEAGGHWLALHGTSGGKAERVEGMRQRRTVKMAHHALLGGFFLTHPPICRLPRRRRARTTRSPTVFPDHLRLWTNHTSSNCRTLQRTADTADSRIW